MLTEEKRLQLDSVVGQMTTNGEADENIQFVVDDFKRLYDQPEVSVGGTATAEPKKDVIGHLGAGIIKGVGSTLHGAARLGSKIIGKDIGEKPGFLEPQGGAEKTGFFLEQLGEFLIPFGGQAKAASLVSKIAPKAGRFAPIVTGAARSVGEAAEFGVKAAVQTGGDTEDVVTAALLGAAAPAVSSAVSAVGKAFTKILPERLYTQVFKVAEDDWRLAVQSQAKGKAINPTLAREVLDRGLFGSSKNMAIYSVKKLDTLEKEVQKLVKTEGIMELPKKQEFVNLLRGIQQQFGTGFFSERAKEAARLASGFEKAKGKFVNAIDALKVKRFLDNLRNSSSFRLDPNLTAKQDELKTAADLIRSTLHKNKAFSKLMDEERVFIRALDAIVDDAAKRQNRRLLNLTDILLGGGGLATGGPFGAAVGIGAVRGFQQPFTLTGIGQMLHRTGQAIPEGTAGVTTKATAAGILQSRRN